MPAYEVKHVTPLWSNGDVVSSYKPTLLFVACSAHRTVSNRGTYILTNAKYVFGGSEKVYGNKERKENKSGNVRVTLRSVRATIVAVEEQ